MMMRSLIVLAISSLCVATVSAKDVKKDPKAELNRDIRRMSKRMNLNDAQQKEFAKTYRAFAKERRQLDEKYKREFAKTLNERQVKAVMHGRDFKHKAFKHQCRKCHAVRHLTPTRHRVNHFVPGKDI